MRTNSGHTGYVAREIRRCCNALDVSVYRLFLLLAVPAVSDGYRWMRGTYAIGYPYGLRLAHLMLLKAIEVKNGIPREQSFVHDKNTNWAGYWAALEGEDVEFAIQSSKGAA